MVSSSSILADVSENSGFESFVSSPAFRNTFLVLSALLVAFILYKVLAPYFVRIDNVFFVSGAPGTGKDLICSDYARKRWRVAMNRFKFSRFFSKIFRKPCKVEEPAFHASIPVLLQREVKIGKWVICKRIVSKPITEDILLLKKRLPNGSIIYISDINRFVNQWTYKLSCVQKNIAEFISEFRQYTKGGYFIANCQQSDQVAKEIRNCFGSCINLLHHHNFLFVHWSEMRRISLSENMTAIETKNNDDKNTNRSNLYLLVSPFIRRYDTYAYYGRVVEMDVVQAPEYKKANTNVFITLPTRDVSPNTKGVEDDFYSTKFKFDKLALVLYLFSSVALGILAISAKLGAGFLIGLPLIFVLWALER